MWRCILSQIALRASIFAVLLTFVFLQPYNVYGQAPQAVTITVTPTEQGATASITTGPVRMPHHPSRVIVRFRNGTRDFLPGSSAARVFAGNRGLFLVQNPPGLSVAEAVRSYRANPNVLYAEPDYEVHALETFPNDALWSDQWDMRKIAAPSAWNTQTNAEDVVVAVVDTGIDFTHPDLLNNLWSSNGSHGFTCINGPCVPGGQDDYGHGTHVAGTIGASGNNGVGIAGINWGAQMIAFKFLDSTGNGYTSDAIEVFEKILALKSQGANIRITNNSWGGGNYSQALMEAMAEVEAAGIVNVCAAGNNGQNSDVAPIYPAAYANRGIVSVLATDSNDAGAYFTNFGLSGVDIAAPGVNTLSTVPNGTCTLCDATGYKYLSGTSMATPHVSGVMAALFHLNPALSAEEARDVILDPNSYDAMANALARTTSSGGRLNFPKAINNPRRSIPGPLNGFPILAMSPDISAAGGTLINLTATASDPDADNLRMAWAKSANASSTWLFGWMANSLFPSPGESSASFTAPTVARTVTVAYHASVADNRGGGASGRQYVTVLPASGQKGPPTQPMSVSQTSAPVGSTITVNYQPVDPDDGQGRTAWDLWVMGNGGASGSCCYTGSSTSLVFNSAGVYRINVQSIDRALDLSARQTAVVTIGGATGVPPIARATLNRLDGPAPLTVNVDMSASSDPDGTIQSYYLDCGGGSWTAGSSASNATCTYDAPGIYWLLMQIRDNSGQTDVMSAYVVATPVNGGASAPSPPTGLTATASNASVTLSWTPSSGATSYSVKRALLFGGPYSTIGAGVTATSYTDYSVQNCTTYHYVVSASNASGESGNSSPASATPLTIPSAPTGLRATAGTGQVSLAWTGSACATSYHVMRGISSGSYSATKIATTLSYVDTGLTNGTTYYYAVSAVNASGESLNSAEASATPVGIPTGLAATAGDTKVTLSWVASNGAASYNVKRANTQGGTYTTIASKWAASPYLDTGLTNGRTYYYMVSGVNGSGESADSTPVSATPMAASSTPTLQSLTISPSKVKGGRTLNGTVSLSSNAPAGGVQVNLGSDNKSVVSVPGSVTVAAGASSKSFAITTYRVTSNTYVTVTATYNGISKQRSILVTR